MPPSAKTFESTALVKPFRAWHYDPSRVDLSRVIAPPYDIISDEENRDLHERDPHNVIRLELGQAKAGETDERKYREAREFLSLWTSQGILRPAERDGFYLHEMSFPHPYQGKMLTRLGIFALLRLEPFERRVVFPHEKTHASPKVDRGKLLRETQANFSPVFSLYEDPTDALDQIRKACGVKAPFFDFTDDRSARHQVWVIHEKEEVDSIRSTFDRKRIFIADGHHRYETALAYAEEMSARAGSDADLTSRYILSAFVRFHDPGLLILPIHRIILTSILSGREALLEALKKYFVLHAVSREVIEKISAGTFTEGFGLAFSSGECYALEMKDWTTARHAMPEGKSPNWHTLDMNLISYLILAPLLQLEGSALEWSVCYSPDIQEAFQKLKSGEASCAWFVRPVTPGVIKEVCESGELMPQKSTYFYPKFPSGLLMYRH